MSNRDFLFDLFEKYSPTEIILFPKFKQNKYVSLLRLNRPIGWMLLLFPCLWAIAYSATSFLEFFRLVILIFVGAIIMRSAGCIINDIVDRKIDAKVERTKNRPIAAGLISVKEALVILFVLLTVALAIVLMLPFIAIKIAFIAVPLIAIYPFLKRYTHYPQVFLGLVFNLGVLISWFTSYGHFTYAAVMLYVASVMWTIVYDTVYAFQDLKDDKEHDNKSLAIWIENRDYKEILWNLYTIQALIMAVLGMNTGMSWVYYLFIAIAAYHLFWQVETLDIHNSKNCNKRFHSNVIFGIIVMVGIILGRI